MAEGKQLLTLQQVADWLAVSDRTVHRMIRDGTLPAVKVGRQWRFEEAAVRAFIRSRERADGPAARDRGNE